MKIQCNSCTKTYLASSEQIGAFGRKVKCTNCNHTWHEYLKETSSKLHSADMQEKKVSGRNFLQNLAFTTLAFATATGLCVVIANGIFPREMNKAYKTISSYKDSISYKLGYKKEQTENPNVKKLVVNKFYQDYLFLSNLRSS
ncbi:MJ0042-type zinc finger domain-containing protein [Wolbachia endosymbiont (group B) of Limnophora tigrina]|uniref:MJ0042-type zinc finger domain-containing protein n=1 Tax=Wolbachia endosymbiont (group B) of Limnophora tigrina TaxID=3139317 RepID=UPI0035B52F41